ncbi:hypothetical protein LTR27_004503 [Elasticomyces elasticus]|nr:hypothetical protein LTR27_004503 [Elasticomyces elasticus]
MKGKNTREATRHRVYDDVRDTLPAHPLSRTSGNLPEKQGRHNSPNAGCFTQPKGLPPVQIQAITDNTDLSNGNDLQFVYPKLHTRVLSDWSLLRLADDMNTDSYELLSTFLSYNATKQTTFQFEKCVDFDIVHDAYLPWLFQDKAFLHSTLLAVAALQDLRMKRPPSKTTLFHLKKTLGSLNHTLGTSWGHHSDAIIWIILTLAWLAAMFGDQAAAATHMAGLRRLVELRGGQEYLRQQPKQHFKLICLDLSWSMCSGSRSHFSEESTSWQSVIVGPLRTDHQFVEALTVKDLVGVRMATIYHDLQRIVGIINDGVDRGDPIKGDLFQHWLASVQNRLLLLECDSDNPISDSLRLGLLAFLSTTIQVPRGCMTYPSFASTYGQTWQAVQAATPEHRLIQSWLLIVGAMSVLDVSEPWVKLRWVESSLAGLEWEEVRDRLEKVMWINCIHDGLGRRAFVALSG